MQEGKYVKTHPFISKDHVGRPGPLSGVLVPSAEVGAGTTETTAELPEWLLL